MLLRRRCRQAGRLPRDAQHRLVVEAADRVRDGEQRLQRRDHDRAGGRQRRRRRTARNQGQGLRHAGRDRRWHRSAGGPRHGWHGDRAGARRRGPDAGGIEGVPPLGARQYHRATGGAAALPRARSHHRVRQARGVRGSVARRSGAAFPRRPGYRRRAQLLRRPTSSRRRPLRRCKPRWPSGSPARCPSSSRRSNTSTPRLPEARKDTSHGTAPLHRGHRRRHPPGNAARSQRALFRPEPGDHREPPVRRRLWPRPGARHADLRDRRDRHGHRRRDGGPAAGGRAVHGRIHAGRHGPGRQRGAALPLHVGRAR